MFASVHIVGSAQDSVIGERWRTRCRELGVKGPQVQILSSRRKTAGQRPFRTKSEAASLLPCSHRCSHGTHSHQPIVAENRWTAERARWLETCPCTSSMTATGECPSSSETVCSGTLAASMCVVRGVPGRVHSDIAHAQILGSRADRPQRNTRASLVSQLDALTKPRPTVCNEETIEFASPPRWRLGNRPRLVTTPPGPLQPPTAAVSTSREAGGGSVTRGTGSQGHGSLQCPGSPLTVDVSQRSTSR